MERTDHLLYIDITTGCPVECKVCMYREEREKPANHLDLDEKSAYVLDNLINHPDADHTIISGEGEPFQNERAMKEILRLSRGNRRFQILTSGIWPAERKLSMLERMAKENGDKYSIRLSLDPFHAAKVPRSCYTDIIGYMIMNPSEHLSLAIRSLVEEKERSRRIIESVLHEMNFRFTRDTPGVLDDDYYVHGMRIPVTYKSTVFPEHVGVVPFSIGRYISALEEKYRRPFTLGNLRSKSEGTGLDITVKMDGSVFFYGAEFAPHGNIFVDDVTFESLSELVLEHPWLRRLYSTPFMDLVVELSRDAEAARMIERINNPYWVVRKIAEYNRELLAEVLADARRPD